MHDLPMTLGMPLMAWLSFHAGRAWGLPRFDIVGLPVVPAGLMEPIDLAMQLLHKSDQCRRT